MAAPLPLVLDAVSWAGNDGNWSVWPIQIGTPQQAFNVLPSTSHGAVWVPLSEGCPPETFANTSSCGASRGAGIFQNGQSAGFQLNSSTTWVDIGIYALPVKDSLFEAEENGDYGNDTIAIRHDNGSVEITGQSAAGISTKDFWLGSLGLAPRAANFSVESWIVRSVLENLKRQNATTSASFGLDVGASYDDAAGSMVLGGFDERASSGHSITASIGAGLGLAVNGRSIVLSNTPYEKTLSITHDFLSVPMTLDSTVSQLWLPRDLCDSIEGALGLTYDESTELYLVNETAHAKLRDLAPTFSFQLAADSVSNETTTITLPYAAFDLQMGPPTFNPAARYFPIRRTRGGYILGRAFLQEAYLVVDWERSNFTIGPVNRQENRTRSIVSIQPPSEASQSHPLSTGAIVGIAIGAAVVVIALIAIVWWRLHARRKRKQAAVEAQLARPSSPYIEDKKIADAEPELEEAGRGNSIHSEAMSSPLYELDREQVCQPERYELAANTAAIELEGKQRASGPQSEQPLLRARSVGDESEASRGNQSRMK